MRRYLVIWIAINCFLIGGCAPSMPDPHVIVSWPHNGAVITLSETLNAHDNIVEPYYYASDYVKFRMLDAIPPTNNPSCPYPAVLIEPRDNGESFIGMPADVYVTGSCSGSPPIQEQSFRWQPQSLGLHTLSAHIIVMNDTGDNREFDSDSVTVCVVGDPLHPPQNIPMGRTNASCNPPIPLTFTATPVTPIPMPALDAVQAYPNPIYYGDTCPSLSTVTFRAALPIPSGTTPDQFTVQAHVRVVIGSASTDSGSFVVNLHPTGTWDTATGGQVFLGALDLSHRYSDANNHFDPASLSETNGALLWYVDASRVDPSSSLFYNLGRSANQVLNLAPCPVSGGNPPSNPPPHNGGGTQSGCEQYTNQTSCNLAGCSWSGATCTVAP